MSTTYHERPGVYTDWDLSSASAARAGSRVVAAIGVSSANAGLYTVTDYRSGAAVFGEDSELGKMLRVLYQNGAGQVLCYPVANESAYPAAIAAVLAPKTARVCVIGSSALSVQQALRDAVMAASDARGECIGVVGMTGATQAALCERASALNCERMVLVGPEVYLDGAAVSGAFGACALAGVLAAQEDPALPLGGAAMAGLDGVATLFDDAAMDALIRGGVTVLETLGGAVSVVRGVTTRTTTGEAADATYRELSTMLIADDVIPAIRDDLRAKFARAKNSEATRAAIRNQVIVTLEDRVRREIIERYDHLTVEKSAENPTVCLVEFGFTVLCGLNQIHLTAHISV